MNLNKWPKKWKDMPSSMVLTTIRSKISSTQIAWMLSRCSKASWRGTYLCETNCRMVCELEASPAEINCQRRQKDRPLLYITGSKGTIYWSSSNSINRIRIVTLATKIGRTWHPRLKWSNHINCHISIMWCQARMNFNLRLRRWSVEAPDSLKAPPSMS